MTEQEIRKLSRQELAELLIRRERELSAVATELDKTRAELKAAKQQLEDRAIALEEAGSIAEASLRLSGIFEAAEEAAGRYMENVRALTERQEELSRRMLEESKRKAKTMLEEAIRQRDSIKREAEGYWDEMSSRLESFYEEHKGLRELLKLESEE